MYSKTNWVDNTTPISATNMNKIETAIENLNLALFSNKFSQLSGCTYTNTSTDLAFSTTDINTLGAVTGTTSKIITIPTGITKIRIKTNLVSPVSETYGTDTISFVKNTTVIDSILTFDYASFTGQPKLGIKMSGESAIITVTAGDTISLRKTSQRVAGVPTFFTVEAIG